MRQRDKAGFTLVELLVVIGIIAVLVSILLPALNRARRAAGGAQCASNMHQIAMAMLQYANDQKGRLIPARVPQTVTAYPSGWFWANELVRLKYLSAPNTFVSGNSTTNTNNVFRCPEGHDDASMSSAGATCPTDGNNNAPVKLASTVEYPIVIPCWYTLNLKMINGLNGDTRIGGANAVPFVSFEEILAAGTANASLLDPGYARKLSMVRRSSQTAMVIEGGEVRLPQPKRTAGRHGPVTNNGKDASTNVAYFDAHVEMVPTQPWSQQGDFTPVKSGTIFYFKDQ